MGINQPTNPAKVTLGNIWAVIQGYTRRIFYWLELIPKYKKEQFEWRKKQAQACICNGSCLYCGCDMKGKIFSSVGCDDPIRYCYPDLMSKISWETYKKEHNIKI